MSIISTSGRGRCSTRSGNSTSAYLFFFALKYDSSDGVAEPRTTAAFAILARIDRDVAGMVARRLFLLVRRIVLFVDDDQREIGDRREDSRTRAHDHARFAALDAMPLLRALFVGERGMQDRNFVAEDLMQIGGNGGREADFRNQKNGGAARFKHRAHAGEINRRLARARYAVQKHAGKLSRVDGFAQPIERGLLR